MSSEKYTYEELENKYNELATRIEQLSRELFLYRKIVETIPYGIHVFDRDGFAVMVNDWQKELLQLPDKEEGVRVFNVLTDRFAVASGMDQVFREALKGEAFGHEVEYDLGHLDNTWNTRKDKRLISGMIIPLKDDLNQVQYVYAVVQDVTDQKHTEQEVREKNEFIQTVLDRLPIGISLNRMSDEKSIYINNRFSEIYGWPAHELLDVRTFFERVYPDAEYREKIMTRIMEDIQSGDPSRLHWEEITVTGKDGTRRVVNAVNIALVEQDIMVSTVMDVTRMKQVENELRQALEKAREADRLKTAFLQNISHEIRTPMNAICGFSEMMKEEQLNAEKRNSYLDIIINSANQLLSIVNDVLSISTIETGQVKVNLRQINVNDLLSDILAMLKLKAAGKQIRLSATPGLPDSQATILTDETKLRQILINLISNAIKFTHDGAVEFGYHTSDRFLEFYVQDTGVGIKPHLHHKIFERFFQAESGYSRSYGGTGLGLSISKSYVELMGGRIWLESQTGPGAKFLFTIPHHTPELTDQAPAMH